MYEDKEILGESLSGHTYFTGELLGTTVGTYWTGDLINTTNTVYTTKEITGEV